MKYEVERSSQNDLRHSLHGRRAASYQTYKKGALRVEVLGWLIADEKKKKKDPTRARAFDAYLDIRLRLGE